MHRNFREDNAEEHDLNEKQEVMKNIYNDLKCGRLVGRVLKVSAILVMIMVWILIDKGNIYGQTIAQKVKTAEYAVVGADSDQSLFKANGDDEGGIIDEGSGVDEDNSFDAYPNPFERDLVFDFEFTVREGCPYEVIDVQGKLVEQGTLQPGSAQYHIDLSQLKTGMYFVRVNIGNSLQVKRLVKK